MYTCITPIFFTEPTQILSDKQTLAQIYVPEDYTLSFILNLTSYNTNGSPYSNITALFDPNATIGNILEFGGRMPVIRIEGQTANFSFGSWNGFVYDFYGAYSLKVIPFQYSTLVHVIAKNYSYEIRFNFSSLYEDLTLGIYRITN